MLLSSAYGHDLALGKHLGEYIADLDVTKVSSNLMNGELQLRHVKLKSTVLDKFDVPARVHRCAGQTVMWVLGVILGVHAVGCTVERSVR